MTILAQVLDIKNSHSALMSGFEGDLVMGAMNEILKYHNEQMEKMTDIFVQGTLSIPQRKYLPSFSGKMLDSRSGANKDVQRIVGDITVAFPLKETYFSIMYNTEQWAYLTVDEYSRQVDAAINADKNRMRADIWRALFVGANYTFSDKVHGNLTVKGLANNDSDLYPNVLGADTSVGIQHNHVKATTYVVSAIDITTNDPVRDAIDDLEEHYGVDEAGSNIVIWAAKDVADKIVDVYTTASKFVPVSDRFVDQGISTATINGSVRVPGKLRGRLTDGAWLVEEVMFPSGYMYAQHIERDAPLFKRVDTPTAATVMPYGLHITSEHANNPLQSVDWINRYGFGVAERLNGLAWRFHATTYTAPTFVG